MKRLSIFLAALLFGFTTIAQESVNISKSEIKWKGKKVTGEHWGYVKLKKGTLEIKDNEIVSGKFIVDMTTINNEDLEDKKWNDKLVGHLKSDDFFSVEKYPESTLKVNESTSFKNGEAAVEGELTIKDITYPVSFIVKKSDNVYTTTVTIDRTKYNIKYGSGKFFDNLGDNMIYDDFTLEVKIVTE